MDEEDFYVEADRAPVNWEESLSKGAGLIGSLAGAAGGIMSAFKKQEFEEKRMAAPAPVVKPTNWPLIGAIAAGVLLIFALVLRGK